MPTITERRQTFRDLHQSGCFAIPNPWDIGSARYLQHLGFKAIATGGTAAYLQEQGLDVERVNKVAQGRPHIVDRMTDGEVQLVFNTTEGWQSMKDSHSIRATALQRKIPYFTTAAASLAVARSLGALRGRALEVRSLQSCLLYTSPSPRD